jgi:glutamate carboxypeptidase
VISAADASVVRAIRDRLRARQAEFIAQLADLVGIDSGTGDIAGVARVGERVARTLAGLGFQVEPAGPFATIPSGGDSSSTATAVVARRVGREPGPRILVVGHLDTVFAAGEAARRPFALVDFRAMGPGVADMKGGLVLLLESLAATRQVVGDAVPCGELVVVLSPDEEIGSPAGAATIRVEARGAAAALVLEPARPGGELISARKGMFTARLVASGRAAHAGVDPERGRSAILALAHATIALHALTDPATGVMCSVGVIRGGDRPNVVPAAATLELDLRAPTPDAMAGAKAAVHAIAAHPFVPDVRVEVEPMGWFAPMPGTPGSRALQARAVGVGAPLGMDIRAVATGGGSDANGIAEVGIPVLDGLGPVGAGAHSPEEQIDLGSVPDRGALLAGLLLALGRDGAGAAR